jgi:hypothetical protein
MATIRDERTREVLIQRINRIRGDEAAVWGKMSVGQMMSHLVQAGEMPFVETMPDRSTFAFRTFVKPLVLYVMPMPKEVKTSPELDQQERGRPPGNFDDDRELVIGLIEKIGTLPAHAKCLHHPMFGPMSAKEWAVIAHKHIDHHLKQFGV